VFQPFRDGAFGSQCSLLVLRAGDTFSLFQETLVLIDVEPLTQVIDESIANHGGSQFEQSKMESDSMLEANAQLAEAREPSMGTLKDLSITSETFFALYPFAGNIWTAKGWL